MLKRTMTMFLMLSFFALLFAGFSQPVEAIGIHTGPDTICPFNGFCPDPWPNPWPDPDPAPWPWPDPDPCPQCFWAF